MKAPLIALVSGLVLAGASGCAFLGGAATGAAAAGAGYEYNAKRQIDQLEADRQAGRISQEEYQKRRQQIEKGSIIY